MNRFLILLFVAICGLLKAQEPALTLPFISGGPELDAGNCITVDAQGNRYLAGNFSGTVDFQGQIITSKGMEDAFIAKFDSLGTLLWVNTVGGVTSDRGIAIDIDTDNNVFFGGTFHSFELFIGDSVIYSCGCSDFAFMSKFTGNGEFVWANSFQGDGATPVKDVVCSTNGNIYFTGNFFNTTWFGTEEITPGGVSDIYIASYSQSGDLLDVKTYGGTGADDLLSAEENNSGDLFITGYFGKKVAFDNDTIESAGLNDIFLAKLDQNLVTLEVKSFGGVGDDRGMGLYLLPSGDVVFSGTIYESAFFDGIEVTGNAYYDIFVAVADPLLNINWVKSFGGGFDDFARNVSSDNLGNIYATGDFMLDVNFTDTVLSANTYSEAFVLKLDNEGNTLWAKSLGGTRHDFGNSLAVTANDKLLFTGSFSDSLFFQSEYVLGNGSADIYIGEINPGENGINESSFINDLTVFPIPSNGIIFFRSSEEILEIEIYNSLGKMMQTAVVNEKGNLDLSSFQTGAYYLKMTTAKGTVLRKIILCN